jgi:hypothetical protein
MAPIDEALQDLKWREEGEQFTSRQIADKYGVDRSTLGRRWEGVTLKKGGIRPGGPFSGRSKHHF